MQMPRPTSSRHSLCWRKIAYTPSPPPLYFALHLTLSIHIIKLTYCNHQVQFPTTTTTQKLHKLNNLILYLQSIGWQTRPPIVITFGIQDTIHQSSIDLLFDLHILKPRLKLLTANLYANVVQYLTHVILSNHKPKTTTNPLQLTHQSFVSYLGPPLTSPIGLVEGMVMS